MAKEIQKAAIKCKYQIFTGFEHGECFKQLENHHKEAEIIQGFITNDGEFVDRQEAMIIARIANQLQYDTDKKTLISEDLHIDWLHKQNQKIKELEKALELACDKIDAEYMNGIYCTEYSDYFKTKAKEMMKDE